MFLASRQADPAAPGGQPGEPSRLAVTRRGYEVRARWRPTPHGSFAGVTSARFAESGEAPALRLSRRHRARSNPSAGWLATVCDRVLADRPQVQAAVQEAALALRAQRNPSFGLVGRTVSQGHQRRRVLVGLQQAGDELGLIGADRFGRLLKAEVGLEPVWQNVAVA